jgi:hypothetical protein
MFFGNIFGNIFFEYKKNITIDIFMIFLTILYIYI